MEQGKRHAALRSNFEAEQIDLGSEAPLSVDGEGSGLVDRRRVSVQWLSGRKDFLRFRWVTLEVRAACYAVLLYLAIFRGGSPKSFIYFQF